MEELIQWQDTFTQTIHPPSPTLVRKGWITQPKQINYTTWWPFASLTQRHYNAKLLKRGCFSMISTFQFWINVKEFVTAENAEVIPNVFISVSGRTQELILSPNDKPEAVLALYQWKTSVFLTPMVTTKEQRDSSSLHAVTTLFDCLLLCPGSLVSFCFSPK